MNRSIVPIVLVITLCRCAGGAGANARPDVAVSGAADASDPPPEGNGAPDANRGADVARDFGPLPPGSMGESQCEGSGFLLCDGFESGSLRNWTTDQDGATVKIEDTRIFRGRKALHITVSNVTGQPYPWNEGNIHSVRRYVLTDKPLYVRAFVYLGTVTPDIHHSVGFTATDGKIAYKMFTEARDDPKDPNRFGVVWYNGDNSGEPHDGVNSKEMIPTGAWKCWEWELRGATNELTFYQDDKIISDLTIPSGKRWIAPKSATLYFGYGIGHPEPTHPGGFDLWIDEIAVHTERIGCAR